jgi:hypothetical protein
MHFNVYDVFYSQFSQQHVSAEIAGMFRIKLLQNYKSTSAVSYVVVTPKQIQIIIISVKIISRYISGIFH